MKVSYKTFKACCKKERPRIYYTWLFHQMAYPLSYVFYRLNMSPNAISVISIALNFVGAYFIIFELHILWGLFFFFSSYLTDCCDGNVARIEYGYLKIRDKNTKTFIRGLAYENLNTNIYSFLFFISMGYYFYTIEQNVNYFFLATAVFAFKILSRYASLHFSMLRKSMDDNRTREEKQLLKRSLPNEIKFFFHRVLNTGRAYYLLFALAFIFIPGSFTEFYVAYFLLLLLLNILKLLLVFIRTLP